MEFSKPMVIERLKEHNLKVTPQRQLILEILEGNRTHPTAEDIYQRVKERFPNTSFTTIYNTLDVLVDLGVIRELNIESDRRHFDPDTSSHQHFICVNCREITDVFADFPDQQQLQSTLPSGYKMGGYTVELFGLCRKCNG